VGADVGVGGPGERGVEGWQAGRQRGPRVGTAGRGGLHCTALGGDWHCTALGGRRRSGSLRSRRGACACRPPPAAPLRRLLLCQAPRAPCRSSAASPGRGSQASAASPEGGVQGGAQASRAAPLVALPLPRGGRLPPVSRAHRAPVQVRQEGRLRSGRQGTGAMRGGRVALWVAACYHGAALRRLPTPGHLVHPPPTCPCAGSSDPRRPHTPPHTPHHSRSSAAEAGAQHSMSTAQQGAPRTAHAPTGLGAP
jgi:hypothetical protein